ncbi:hypothetical protein NST17_19875 [Caldifermentibacillus hisashii]|uniref:Uncharacterized protein n=1 Tax=Caldifermentibacillus hisashii TaxID=996558 RepID=A0ABU9K2Z1_9BACI
MTTENEVQIKVAKLEEKIIGHENRIEVLEENANVLPRLTTLMEFMTENQRAQQKQVSQQHETLVKINENLDRLNKGLDDVTNRVDIIEEERLNDKLKEIQEEKSQMVAKEQERKGNIMKIVTGVLTSVIATALILYFGLK